MFETENLGEISERTNVLQFVAAVKRIPVFLRFVGFVACCLPGLMKDFMMMNCNKKQQACANYVLRDLWGAHAPRAHNEVEIYLLNSDSTNEA